MVKQPFTKVYFSGKLKGMNESSETKRPRGRPRGLILRQPSDGIKRLREHSDMTQEQLAHHLGITQKTVYLCERDSVLPASKDALAKLKKLAKTFRVPIEINEAASTRAKVKTITLEEATQRRKR